MQQNKSKYSFEVLAKQHLTQDNLQAQPQSQTHNQDMRPP